MNDGMILSLEGPRSMLSWGRSFIRRDYEGLEIIAEDRGRIHRVLR